MSDPTTIRRLPERGTRDSETIASILDEGLVCHVGYLAEDGRPVVIPTLYARDGDRLLLHGSNTSGVARAVRRGSPLSVTVTLVDGIVVARSGFHSSANYRSVVVHGTGTILEGPDHARAVDLTVERLIPGRSADIRPHTKSEMKQTTTIALSLETASAKIRIGPPKDDVEDLDSEAWAGVVPLRVVAGTPEPAPDLRDGIDLPDYLDPYRR